MTARFSPIGATVWHNLDGALQSEGMTPRYIYETMDIRSDRFWAQFKRPTGPRLDLLDRMATQARTDLWRLLIREGDTIPSVSKRYSGSYDKAAVRAFIRSHAAHFIRTCEIPTERGRMTRLGFVVRQNAAIGCWQKWITEADLYHELGFSRARWGGMFRRKTGPSLADVWRIAESLEMQPWEMMAPLSTGDGS